jgi:nitroreductase
LFISVYNEFNTQGNPNPIALYDLGQSIAHLTVQATYQGLYIHQMTGFDHEKAREIFDLPDGYKAASVAAVGYMGHYNDLHPNLVAGEISIRQRRDLSETVFSGKFGQTSKLFEKGTI